MKTIIIMAAVGLFTLAPVNAKHDNSQAFKSSWAEQTNNRLDKGDMRRVRDWLIQFFFGN